jgi:hypothetical protein
VLTIDIRRGKAQRRLAKTDGVRGVLQTANRFCVIGAVYRGHPPLLEFSTLLRFDPFSPRPSTTTLLVHPSMAPSTISKTRPSQWVSNPRGPIQWVWKTPAGTSNTSPLGPSTTARLPKTMPIKRLETLLPNPFPIVDRRVVIELSQAPTESRSRKLSTLRSTIQPGSFGQLFSECPDSWCVRIV